MRSPEPATIKRPARHRPTIICHMVTPIDGRLHPSRFTVPAAGIDGARPRRHDEAVTEGFGADGWMVGRKTMLKAARASTAPS